MIRRPPRSTPGHSSAASDVYKRQGNRSDAPDDLIPQFEYIRKSVLAFNLPSIELLNYEADDLIATYSEQILKLGGKVTIVSSDKDLMQLYKKNIRIYDPMKNKFVTEDDIKNKFGVGAEKVIDVQSLACLLYTSPSPRDGRISRMPSSA